MSQRVSPHLVTPAISRCAILAGAQCLALLCVLLGGGFIPSIRALWFLLIAAAAYVSIATPFTAFLLTFYISADGLSQKLLLVDKHISWDAITRVRWQLFAIVVNGSDGTVPMILPARWLVSDPHTLTKVIRECSPQHTPLRRFYDVDTMRSDVNT